MTERLLEVRGLHAGYGKAEVLVELSLHIERGTIVSVLGPNGAGKSTLLNAIAGTLPSRGEIILDGHRIDAMSIERRVVEGLSLVPERRELFTTLTVEENLRLGGNPAKVRGQKDWLLEIEHVYALFPRLRERARQASGTLSGGERQMLAVGRALMSKPTVLMLDEPSLGLAPLIVADMMSAIAKLKESGLTVLLVEQNARTALEISDRAYVLESGDFVLEGAARDLQSNPRLIESYLGSRKAEATNS